MPTGAYAIPAGVGLLETVWRRLQHVDHLTFRATPGVASRTRWRGQGVSSVTVESTVNSRRLIESGHFWPDGSSTRVSVRNVYLWQRDGTGLLLAHERSGRANPVFLLRLAGVDDVTLQSREPHHCALDQYHATLRLTDEGFDLDWIIKGPRKDEQLLQKYATT